MTYYVLTEDLVRVVNRWIKKEFPEYFGEEGRSHMKKGTNDEVTLYTPAQYIADQVDMTSDNVLKILGGRAKWTTWTVADKILSAIERVDVLDTGEVQVKSLVSYEEKRQAHRRSCPTRGCKRKVFLPPYGKGICFVHSRMQKARERAKAAA